MFIFLKFPKLFTFFTTSFEFFLHLFLENSSFIVVVIFVEGVSRLLQGAQQKNVNETFNNLAIRIISDSRIQQYVIFIQLI